MFVVLIMILLVVGRCVWLCICFCFNNILRIDNNRIKLNIFYNMIIIVSLCVRGFVMNL